MLPYWASVGGLFWPTTFAFSIIKSLIEGELDNALLDDWYIDN